MPVVVICGFLPPPILPAGPFAVEYRELGILEPPALADNLEPNPLHQACVVIQLPDTDVLGTDPGALGALLKAARSGFG